MLERNALEAFLEVVEAGSIRRASERHGRSRATYLRQIRDLQERLGAPELIERGKGQRQVRLTKAGRELARRARIIVEGWRRWEGETVRAVRTADRQIRVGALAGAFDLLADVVQAAHARAPETRFVLVEHPATALPEAVAEGHIDVAVGAAPVDALPSNVAFEAIGPLPWSVIVPAGLADTFRGAVRLADLDGRPMVVHRSGPTRHMLERWFERYPGGPLTLRPAVEVESTPRMVDMVAKGFGPAIVTRFRLQYLPDRGVAVRDLVDGPPPLVAGLYTRTDDRLPAPARRLVAKVRADLDKVVAA